MNIFHVEGTANYKDRKQTIGTTVEAVTITEACNSARHYWISNLPGAFIVVTKAELIKP